jgi:hemerythrin
MFHGDNVLITWNDKLVCGVKIIDDQHKELVDLVNEMYNHVSGNYVQERNYFNRVTHELLRYIRYHFATEEKIMIATRFAGYAEHKMEHDCFIFNLLEKIRDYEAGKRFTLSSFTRFLKDWILSHVTYMDKQYFEHLKKSSALKRMN